MVVDDSCSAIVSSGVGGSSTGGIGGTGGGDIASRNAEIDEPEPSLLAGSIEKPLGGGMDGGIGGLGGGGESGLRSPADEARLSLPLGLWLIAVTDRRRSMGEAGPGDISSLSLADTVITDTVEHFPERRPVLDGDFAWRRLPLGVPTVMDRFPTSVPPLENLCIPAVPSAPSSLPESEDDSSPNTPPELCRFLPTTCTENRTGITISFL
ncbi:unnamed protein product [Ixodes persulcatus]